jgi:hypothetical protein
MILPRHFKLSAAVIGLAVPILCFAGRPVIHDLALSDLTRASDIIAVVTREGSEVALGRYGCESQVWRLSIVTLIKSSAQTEAKPGDIFDVRRNVTFYADCVFREGWKTTGVSFSASRYKPSVPDAPEQERFIVFLQPGEGGYQLTTDLGFDSVAKLQEVAQIVRQQVAQQDAPADRREAAPAAEH